MKRPLAYITTAWCGEDYKNTEQAARYYRAVYEAGFSPICPTLYLPLFLNDAVPEEHKSGIDMSRDLLRRSHVLVGEYLKFPTTPEEVQALLKRIGIDGVRYEEIFITDFDGDVLGLYDHLGEYENIDELNHLACVISELDQGDLEKFEAVIDSGEYTGSVKELINLAQNLDCFEFYPGVTDDETLGRIYVEDMEAIDVPEHLLNYFDYEAYGRDIRLNEDGHYAPGGYVLNNGGSFIEHYHGREGIPDEHKVFSMPKLNIREQMAAYKEVIDRSSLEGERLHPRKEVPER